MKRKHLEVNIKLQDGSTLPEISHNAVTYLVAASGQEFTVEIRRRSHFNGTLRVCLSVDGHSTGYSKLLHDNRPTCFDGIVVQGDGSQSHTDAVILKRFQFAEATNLDVEAAPAENLDFQVGKLQLEVSLVRQGAAKTCHTSTKRKELDSKPPRLHDGKKWFLGPSLHAGAGKEEQTNMQFSPYEWIKVAQLESIELRYETAATLALRKIVNPANPEHARLIQPFLEQEAERLVAAGVKQEREAQASGSGAASALITVDLTQNFPLVKPEFRPLKLAADEYAACDLTGDEEAAVWDVRKKPRVTLR